MTNLNATVERRQQRSSDPLVALHYQLTSTRARGLADAIVVADASGIVVAGSGSWPLCEELAAYAPLLADGPWAEANAAVSSRVEAFRADVEVRTLDVGGQQVLLCARRSQAALFGASESLGDDLDAAALAVSRILRDAA